MTNPAAETKSIGLPADAQAVMVFAIPLIKFTLTRNFFAVYRDSAVWTALSGQENSRPSTGTLQKPRHRLTQTAHKPKQWFENSEHLPNVLFLDLNMSCKNDFECLCDIKEYEKLKDLHVVMLSTSYPRDRNHEPNRQTRNELNA
jgi:CheY-like chemotaxis protein